jgi:hypothetical protein
MMGLPICCGEIMRVGVTSGDHMSQVVYCTKCGRSVVQTVTTKKKENGDATQDSVGGDPNNRTT